MTNDVSDPPKTVVYAPQDLKPSLTSPRLLKENIPDTSQSYPSNPPETPIPPSTGATNDTRAPEPVILSERHHAALRHIQVLETHNAKLYQDNCRLVNAVNMLNDRLAFLGAPQNVQLHRLSELQEKLCASENNRALISQKYQDLQQCISSGSAHHHVNLELQATRDAYALLEKDHRHLSDKYFRLKAVVDANRGIPARVPIPVIRSEFTNGPYFHPSNQDRNNLTPSVSTIDPFQTFDQSGNHQRRSPGNLIAQPSHRPGRSPVSVPLPTPPPNTPVAGGQISPTGLPVHASVPTGPLPFPHHSHSIPEPRISFTGRSSALALSQLPSEKRASEQFKVAIHLRRHSGELTNIPNNELVSFGKQHFPVPLESGPRPPKRSSREVETLASSEEERKKLRIEGETPHPPTVDGDTRSASMALLPPVPTDDRRLPLSGSNVRTYEDCVDLIFEKDADVENGIFCGLCFDRYEAKMIQEPPDVLVQPDFDFLVKHCMTMHPTVWDDLRRKA